MYEAYWGLKDKPFENNMDVGFYYPSDSHQAALLKLRYVVENGRQGGVLTGLPGLGKSMIVRSLFGKLPETVDAARPFGLSANAGRSAAGLSGTRTDAGRSCRRGGATQSKLRSGEFNNRYGKTWKPDSRPSLRSTRRT